MFSYGYKRLSRVSNVLKYNLIASISLSFASNRSNWKTVIVFILFSVEAWDGTIWVGISEEWRTLYFWKLVAVSVYASWNRVLSVYCIKVKVAVRRTSDAS